MQTLMIEQPVPHLIPNGPLVLVLVGCGGTGSHLAQSLARIATHASEQGIELYLCFIDGDIVEDKNVGRQLFAPSDVGKNKAQVLAARFSALFGLNIVAVPQMANKEIFYSINRPSGGRLVIIGAVDSHSGRQAMHNALRTAWTGYDYWLDCGNHESAGQVVLGNTTIINKLRGAVQLGGICTALPAASLLYPELLEQPPAPAAGLDCAQAMVENAQSLMVNQMMAAIAAEYTYKIVFQRQIETFQTVVDLSSMSMRSTPITARTLAEATDLTVEDIEMRKSNAAA